MTAPKTIALSQFTPGDFIRPNDAVIWGQVTGEPIPIVEALMARRSEVGGRFSAFLGARFSNVVQPEHADVIDFRGIGGIGTNRTLYRAGVLDVLPVHISAVAEYIRGGVIGCDVAIVQLSPPDEHGRYGFATVADYIVAATQKARCVIGEVNHSAPRTNGPHYLTSEQLSCIIETDRQILQLPPAARGDIDRAIGARAVAYIPDRAVVQVGIGAVPETILSMLSAHKDLGVHSGMIGDALVDLIEAGVVTNAFKPFDQGVSVTGTLVGTDRLYRFADRNPLISLQSTDKTHSGAVLSAIPGLVSINSAIEVDLTGQVNAESVGTAHVGAVGGAVDFVRGAHTASGGRSLIALPSTAANGSITKIVPQLSGPVSTSRSDVDVIITEFGAAELRGRSLRERTRAMIGIAHPDFREQLERAAHELYQQ